MGPSSDNRSAHGRSKVRQPWCTITSNPTAHTSPSLVPRESAGGTVRTLAKVLALLTAAMVVVVPINRTGPRDAHAVTVYTVNTTADPGTGTCTIALCTLRDAIDAANASIGLPGIWLFALGTNGQYFDVWSTDVVGEDAHAVFVMLFGSWFGNWDDEDDIMRSVLITPSLGLACCMAGRPHWFFHHMGLGETIGYGTRLTMNNSTLYQNQTNGFPRAVYIALMGDPTLRMDPVAPPAALSANRGTSSVMLRWSASPDAVLGYHIYRASVPAGPFSRLTSSLVTGTTFTDAASSSNAFTYMVRAVKLQTTPSGTYSNASQGIFVSAPASFALRAAESSHSLVLTWNSQSGTVYRVLTKTNLNQAAWTDSGYRVTATGTSASWTDTSLTSNPQRFYKIVSP